MLTRSLILVTLLLSSPVVSAWDFEFSLGDTVGEILFATDSKPVGGWGGSQIYGGLLFTDDSDYIGELGAMARRPPSPKFPLTAGVGVRGYLGTLDEPDASVAAVAIGGELRYTIPSKTPMAILGELHWAPPITSFADTDEVLDWMIRYQIEILPDTLFTVSYRDQRFDVAKNDFDDRVRTAENLMLGLRFSF